MHTYTTYERRMPVKVKGKEKEIKVSVEPFFHVCCQTGSLHKPMCFCRHIHLPMALLVLMIYEWEG